MKPKEAWGHYYDHTGNASAVARKLGYSGIALVWIFSGGGLGNAAEVTIDGRYLWPLYLLVVGLAADFLQYVYLAAAWRLFARSKDGTSEDFLAPWWLSTAGEVFFAVKLGLIGVGYAWLLVSLWQVVV